MSNTNQPKALRVADWLSDWLVHNAVSADLEAACVTAVAELRRLFQENENTQVDNRRLYERIEQLQNLIDAAGGAA